MPSNYKRTSNRQSWNEETMKLAIMEVFQGKCGYRLASRKFSVPQSTIEDRVKIYRKTNNLETAAKKFLGRFKPIFNTEQENLICRHIQDLKAQQSRITYRDIRHFAFQIAEKNNIDHKFNRGTELAGMDWLHGFLRRHPELSFHLQGVASVEEAIGCNRVSVSNFFSLLNELQDKYKFLPTKIFNVDETGITTVPKNKSKILSFSSISSADRSQLITAVMCVSATGVYIPPLLIFPRARMTAELLEDAPLGAIALCHPTGWNQNDIFVYWLDHFIANVKPSKNSPVLLLLDGHATHSKNIPFINKAKDNGVIIVSFPPDCTHRLQPFDVSITGPLSTFYREEVATWLLNNPSRVVTQFQIGKLFGTAYAKAATLENATGGFSKTGIYPLNPNVFSDDDFVSSSTTDNDVNEATTSSTKNIKRENVDTDEADQHLDKALAKKSKLEVPARSLHPSTTTDSTSTSLEFSSSDSD